MNNPFPELVTWLAASTGLDRASCKILTCLALSFPVSAVFKRLPDDRITLKNVYIMTVSALYIAFVLQIYGGFFVLLFNAMVTFVLTKYYRSRLMPWVNFTVLMLLLCSSHLKTQFTRLKPGDEDIDVTGAQMVLVMKLTSFAWSYRDGMLYHSDKERFNRELNQFQRSRAIVRPPTILSFLGYVFFYASIVTGPSFDYADYQRFILTEAFDDVPESKRPGRRRKRKIPKSGRVAALKVLQGLFWAALLFALKGTITFDYEQSPAFMSHNFFYRIAYMYVMGFVMRLKYYTAWLISEAACVVVGLGYNGYDPNTGKLYWNRVQNVDPFAFELGQNVHDCLEAWNMNANKWLKNSVYLRCCAHDAKTGKPITGFLPTLATFVTSAFWHGTMPGYYCTFVAGAILQTVGKVFRRNLRPLFITRDGQTVSKWKPAYDLVCWVVTQLAFGYIVQPFAILDLKPSLLVWRSVYFWIHVLSVGVIVLFNGPTKKTITPLLRAHFLLQSAQSPPETMPTPAPAALAQSKAEFTDTHNLSLPTFDNQAELQDTVQMMDFERISRLSSEFAQWQAQQSQPMSSEETQALKEALRNLQSDIGSYISALDSDKKD